jgi:hypothetical protein
MTNRAGNYHFGGRYTLMNISGTWNIYDRDKGGCVKSLDSHTFTKAEQELFKFKIKNKDEVV